MAEKKVIELEVNSNLGNLKQQLKQAQIEVQTLAEKFGATSAQAVEAAKKAAILKDKIADAKALTDAFNPDAKFKALSGSLTGVAGGFSVVTGAMAAFGKQNEDVEKALLKVQGAMALASGAQAIGESIDSFKQLGAVIKANAVFQAAYNFIQTGSIKGLKEETVAKVLDTEATVAQGTAMVATTTATTGASAAAKVLRAALISTGVGALVVGVGLLIENFDYLKEKFNGLGTGAKVLLSMIMPVVGVFWALSEAYNYFASDSIKANAKAESAIKKNTAALNQQIKSSERASEALKTKNGHELNMAKATGASAEAIRKLTLKHADEAIALDKASLATARNTYEKEKNTLANMVANGVSDELIEKQKELVKKARENVTEERKDLVKSYEEKKAVVRNNEVEIAQEIFDKKQKIKENSKKEGKELIDITKNIEDEKLRLQEEGLKKELDGLKLKYARKKEEEDKQLKEKTLTQKDYDTLQKQATESLEFDKKQIIEKYVNQESQLKTVSSRNAIQGLVDSSKTRLEIEKATSEKSIEIAKAEAEKKRTIEEKKIQMTMDGLSIINDLFQMNAGKSEKDARRAFKAQKAFNLASALTNTYLAVTSALANSKELFPGQRFIEAGLAGVAGAVQVAKISKTQFTSSASSADTSAGGGGATAPTMSAPQFNVVGQSGVNQLASLNQQPIQAYVVSGQVTSQQALDRNRLANATLGG